VTLQTGQEPGKTASMPDGINRIFANERTTRHGSPICV
jgi:hypothetical protein